MSSVRNSQSTIFSALLHHVAEDEDERNQREDDRAHHPRSGEAVPGLSAARHPGLEDPGRLFGCDDGHNAAFPPWLPPVTLSDGAGEHVHEDRDDEQDDAQPDQRGPVRARRLAELVGDDGRHRVARGEDVERDLTARPDHEGDGDRLTHRPAEAEHDRADDAAATRGNTVTRIISQRVAPMPSAAFLSSCGDGREGLAGERGDDRRDHHREDQARGHEARGRRTPGRRRCGRAPGCRRRRPRPMS